MRLLLDAHLSPKRIGDALRATGHDVVALASEPAARALPDADVLALASAQRRITVTCDCAHLVVLARALASREEHHAGLILIWSRGNDEYAAIVDDVLTRLGEYPRQRAWIDRVVGI